MLKFYLTISFVIIKVFCSEDGNHMGLPYLPGSHSSQYSTKFQRAFESIGTVLSNQGSKDIELQINEQQTYPRTESQRKVNEHRVENEESDPIDPDSPDGPDEQNESDQLSQDNRPERLGDDYWTQMFLKHDNQKKNSFTEEIQQRVKNRKSKILVNSNNEENDDISNENENEEPNKSVPIEIPVDTTPTALFVIKAPSLANGDKEWTINKQNNGQQKQYSDIPEDNQREYEGTNGRDREPEPYYYPQQPIIGKPKIQSIEAKCGKDVIHVRVTYDKPFDGIIYAKDHYNDMSCHFVEHRSGQMIFEFSLELNHCGTTLIDEYETKGETVLQNTLIFQNEPIFQEIWDSVRELRCAWSGVFDKTVQTSINVGVLDSQTITYRGDSVESVMDVQYGHGLNAAPVQGFVRIGDDLTISVSLIGADANNFDLRIKDCIAHDGDVRNSVQLTDESGCVLKKKLLGQWQKQRNVGHTSVTAFSYMQAFRFPEKMEVYFECNIEICKYECKNFCPDSEELFIRSQSDINEEKLKTRAKRTAKNANNANNDDTDVVEPIRLLRGIRVVVPNDLDFIEPRNLSSIAKNELMLENDNNVCVPLNNFIITLFVVLITLIVLSLISAILCLKYFENKPINRKPIHIFR